MSVVQYLNLPPTFTSTVLVFTLLLALSPYLAGANFGIFRLPQFTRRDKRVLRLVGPLSLALVLLLFVPVPWLEPVSAGAIGSQTPVDPNGWRGLGLPDKVDYTGYDALRLDIDRDGLTDAVLVGEESTFIYLRASNGEYEWPRRSFRAGDLYPGYARHVEDINRDGFYDLIYSGPEMVYGYLGTSAEAGFFDHKRVERRNTQPWPGWVVRGESRPD